MKQLQNNFTTPEQSKRLLEIGVPRWTADDYRDKKGYRHSLEGILDVELFFQNFPDYLPCWSVGRLMEIYEITGKEAPQCITTKKDCARTENIVRLFEENVGLLDFSKLNDK